MYSYSVTLSTHVWTRSQDFHSDYMVESWRVDTIPSVGKCCNSVMMRQEDATWGISVKSRFRPLGSCTFRPTPQLNCTYLTARTTSHFPILSILSSSFSSHPKLTDRSNLLLYSSSWSSNRCTLHRGTPHSAFKFRLSLPQEISTAVRIRNLDSFSQPYKGKHNNLFLHHAPLRNPFLSRLGSICHRLGRSDLAGWVPNPPNQTLAHESKLSHRLCTYMLG